MANDFRARSKVFMEGILRDIRDTMRDAVRDGVKDGAETVELFVATRGTEKSGKQGRVETGAMIGSVDSEITEDSADEIEGRFGFIDNPPDWVKFQEEGFNHVGGVSVEGMNTLVDAGEIIIAQVLEDIEKGLRNA